MAGAARTRRIFTLTAALLAVLTAVSLLAGKYPISPSGLLALLTGGAVPEMTARVFCTLRLPRTLMALLGGAGLGLAGGVYQTVFRNPLASPDVIGVSSGVNLGAAAAIVLAGGGTAATALGGFLGGLLAVSAVLALARAAGERRTVTYVLAGVVISSLSQTGIMLLKYFADSESRLAAIEYWAMGSLSAVTARRLLPVLPFWLAGFAGLLLLRRQIGLLSLNEDECRALGVPLGAVRRTVLALSTLLVASVICVTGLISFAGLIAPHIARLLLRRQNTAALILGAMVGGAVLLAADILARVLYAAELPVSILTTLIGVPVLAALLYWTGREEP